MQSLIALFDLRTGDYRRNFKTPMAEPPDEHENISLLLVSSILGYQSKRTWKAGVNANQAVTSSAATAPTALLVTHLKLVSFIPLCKGGLR